MKPITISAYTFFNRIKRPPKTWGYIDINTIHIRLEYFLT